MKVIIIGGVAGGASCAARLRRLDENAEIVMVERGPYVSYANCGLPYHVGGVIPEESSLLVATAEMFKALFRVDARTNCEAVAIDPEGKTVDLKDTATGEVTTESYDKLVLSPGAPSVRPPLPGIDLPGIFVVRTVPDARKIRQWLDKGTPFLAGMSNYSGIQAVRPKTRAVVVGGGFIGLETAENLVHRGFDVTLLEMGDQVLGPLDPEMARMVEGYLEHHGVKVVLNDGAAEFRQTPNGALEVHAQSGALHLADIVILGLGVRPDTALAQQAGLEIGELGGIRTDEQMRTSEPDIFAAGDAVEVRDFVTGEWSLVALAGPANRQGRIIEKIYLFPNSHAGYYPGAKPIAMKVLFRKSDGRLLGAQALGEDGVDKRVSALAGLLQMDATVYDLEESELCYAPQFGSAKDPVNFAGMIAAGVLGGDMPISHWHEMGEGVILDVRDPFELAVEKVEGAVNIPLGQLRDRLDELPRDRTIHVFCRSGQRSYYATRLLLQNGFDVKNISGGMLSRTYSSFFLQEGPIG
jgi:NADPH-dependent 2,4-dienoyl-CoA reductase/sulfur reductase-like enzyme/rhodanese-related sulfurtransferase